VTSATRVPRVGVAIATSTSREASCTPTSTPSSWHCTSPSTSCSALAADRDGRPGSATPNWSAWPSPKSCSASARSGAGCALPTSGWGTCFPTCRPRRPTTGGCAGPRRWSPSPSRTSPRAPRAGGISCGWSTPPRCHARPPARRSTAQPCGPMPAMATARATTATSGASGCTCWPAPTGCRSPGAWPPQARGAGGGRGAVGP
jgi:hypothetical protein